MGTLGGITRGGRWRFRGGRRFFGQNLQDFGINGILGEVAGVWGLLVKGRG